MQARAAATLDISPVEVIFPLSGGALLGSGSLGGGGGVGSTGSGIATLRGTPRPLVKGDSEMEFWLLGRDSREYLAGQACF
jgi:hypothetical protein